MLIFVLSNKKSIVYNIILFTFVQRIRQSDIWTALQQDLAWTVLILKNKTFKALRK